MILIYILMEAIEPRFDPVGRTATSCSRLWLKTSTQACFFNASPLPPLPREKTALLLIFKQVSKFHLLLVFSFHDQAQFALHTKKVSKNANAFWKKEKTMERHNFCNAKVEVERSFRRRRDLLSKYVTAEII